MSLKKMLLFVGISTFVAMVSIYLFVEGKVVEQWTRKSHY